MRFEDHATINILARASGSIFLLVSSIIMVRCLSKEDYGTFLQVMLIINTIVMLAFVGLPQSVFYYYPQTQDKTHLVKQSLMIGMVISVFASSVVFGLRGFLGEWFNNPDLEAFVLPIALLILCQGPIAFRDPILLSQNAYFINSVLTFIACLVQNIPLYIALYLEFSLREIIYVFLGSSIVNLLLFLCMISYLLSKTRSRELLQQGTELDLLPRVSLSAQVRYSFPIGIASFIGILGKQIDKYIISFFFLPAQFAVYSRGAMEVPLVGHVTYTLNDMMMSAYVEAYKKNDIAGFLKLMHVTVDKVAKLNFAIFVFLFYEGELLMEILYTKQYLDATPIFQAYLFLFFLSVTVYGMVPRVTGKTRQLTVATTLSVVLNICLSLGLIQLYGPIGAAVGTVFGSLVYMIYLLYYAVRSLNVGWGEVMPWKTLGLILLVAILSGSTLWGYHVILSFLDVKEGFWTLCGAFTLYVYGYLVILNFIAVLSLEDREYLRRWLRVDILAIMPRLKEVKICPTTVEKK